MSDTNKLTRQVINALNDVGHYVFRVNNITARQRKGIIHRGIPDIMGITRTGIALGLEIKTGNDRQSEYQKDFADEWKMRGGIYKVITQIEDIEHLL